MRTCLCREEDMGRNREQGPPDPTGAYSIFIISTAFTSNLKKLTGIGASFAKIKLKSSPEGEGFSPE